MKVSDNNDKNFDNMRYDEQEIAAEKRQKTEKIAAEIIQMSKNKLLVNMRFMDMSLNQFQIFPKPGYTPFTEIGRAHV